MSFATRCPTCRTTFRVGATQLGAADGWVRCGRCDAVFDAAQAIVADGEGEHGADGADRQGDGVAGASVAPPAAAPAAPAAANLPRSSAAGGAVVEDGAVATPAGEGDHDRAAALAHSIGDDADRPSASAGPGVAAAPSEADATAAAHAPLPSSPPGATPAVAVAFDEAATAGMSASPWHGDAVAAASTDAGRAEPGAARGVGMAGAEDAPWRAAPLLPTSGNAAGLSVAGRAPAAVPPSEGGPYPPLPVVEATWPAAGAGALSAAAGSAALLAGDASAARTAGGDTLPGGIDGDPPAFAAGSGTRRRRSAAATAALVVAAVLLVLALALQAALHWRDLLAAARPPSRPALDALCVVAGCRVEPLRRLGEISVESSALTAAPSGRAVQLVLVLRNRDRLPLALPWVDLKLTEVNGRLLARRALSPAELGATSATIAPAAEAVLRATLAVDGRPPSGYTVELFHP